MGYFDYEMYDRNIFHEKNSPEATNTMFVGGIVAFIGISMWLSFKKQPEASVTSDKTVAKKKRQTSANR